MKSLALLMFGLVTASACAQAVRPLGSVSTADADVTSGAGGTMAVSGGRALLLGNSTVTAKNRTAVIALARGGTVSVCQSSGLHLTDASGTSSSDAALLFALDRGALEFRLKVTPRDVLLTPDLRFTSTTDGLLDLQLRVTRNGDTCVDNRGRKAPVLNIVDAFGQSAYQLKPGQHVFFEHGSLREVVDRETTPCGCPPEEKAVPLAEAALRGGAMTPQQAAAAHPFPAAVSAGLAEPEPRQPETTGELHTQVAQTLTYDPSQAAPPPPAALPSVPVPAAALTPPPSSPGGPLHAIGHFFHRLFVR